MNKTEIKNNYNVVKIVSSNELLTLSQTYKDNLDTIIVMMKRKEKSTQPPAWFEKWNREVFQEIIKLNNLKTK